MLLPDVVVGSGPDVVLLQCPGLFIQDQTGMGKEYYQRNRAVIREKARLKYHANIEAARAYHRAYREANKEKLNLQGLAYYHRTKHKKPIELRRAQWREQKKREYSVMTREQKDERNEAHRAYMASHPEKAKQYSRRDYLHLKAKANEDAEFMEAIRARQKRSKQKAKADPKKRARILSQARERYRRNRKPPSDKSRKYQRDWLKRRRDTDPNFKIAMAVRTRIKAALRGYSKSSRSAVLIGCSWEVFIAHLESLWTEGMSWSNYGCGVGRWNVDHIKPCAAFDLTNPVEQQICFHYSNIRPCWHTENQSKGSLWNGVRHRYVKNKKDSGDVEVL